MEFKGKARILKKKEKKVNIGFIIADTLTKNLSTDVTKNSVNHLG